MPTPQAIVGAEGDLPAAAPTTADRLLDAAEYLFARGGIAAVTTRQIVEAAGQRNVSSISYHFGSRDGLLLAILARRGGPVDAERGRLRAMLAHDATVADLIRCLVMPQCELLNSPTGRSYIRIVGQLRGRYAHWRRDSDVETTANLLAILDEIEALAPVSAALGRERVLSMIMLMTASTAKRARRLDDWADGANRPELGHGEYVDNLGSMCSAVLMA